MEVIGPTTAEQIGEACSALEQAGASLVLIDGAFGRRAFASARIADAIVLAAGLAAASSLEAALEQARSAIELLLLSTPPPDRPGRFFPGALTDSALEENPARPGDVVIAEDFASIFLSGERRRALESQGIALAVRRPARLLAVTANPSAPGRPAVPAARFFEALWQELAGVALFDLRANLARGV